MTPAALVRAAAEPLLTGIAALSDRDLTRPTPCDRFDVRALANHLMFWGPSLAGAAERRPVPPPAPEEGAVDLLPGGDWRRRWTDSVTTVVEAWSEPSAWEGSTTMGMPPELPAATVGGMVLGELVVHGWDLARATGYEAGPLGRLDPGVTDLLLTELAATAAWGRELGVYGPEVPVPASAPALHRVLGLTGRDPAWSPATAFRPAGPR